MTGQSSHHAFLRLPSNRVGSQEQRFSLSTNTVVLGRDPSCEIVLDSHLYADVSRRHAEITRVSSSQPQGVKIVWQICDLNSANGTYINGSRLYGCQTLQAGDRLQLGQKGPEFSFECLPHAIAPVAPLPQQSAGGRIQGQPSLSSFAAVSWSKALWFAAWGAVSGAIGGLLYVPFGGGWNLCRSSYTEAVVATSLEGAVFGACLAVALMSAFTQYFKRGFQFKRDLNRGIWIGLLAGAIAGAIADIIYISLGATGFTQTIAWGIEGSLLGLGLSFRIPNLGRQRSLVGGLVGGLLGGSLFVVIGNPDIQCTGINSITNWITVVTSYLFGDATLGFFIGLVIVIVEAAFQPAWLEIRYAPRDSRTVILGPDPICVGSDPFTCTIYDRNAPPVAMRYRLTEGQIVCEDVLSGTVRHLQPGEHQTVGDLTVIVRTGGTLPTQGDRTSK